MTFTYGLSNGESIVKSGNAGIYDSTEHLTLAYVEGNGIDNESKPYGKWIDLSENTIDVTTFFDEEDNYWTENGYAVSDEAYTSYEFPVPPVLETLTASGSLTNVQIVGTTPDLAGLTFTAGYSDGSSTTVSSSAITVSPATYDASGNPDNLKEVDLTFSYTDGEVTATTGLDNVVTHRPDTQSIAHDTNGHIYFDYDEHYVNVSGDTTDAPLGAMDLLSDGGSQGEWAVAFFDATSYTNDTTVDGTALTSWMGDYGLVVQESGTINTDGFVPQTGYSYYGLDHLNQCYISWSQDGTNASTTGNVYIIAAPLANNVSAGGYKKTDFDTTAQYAKVYTVNIT